MYVVYILFSGIKSRYYIGFTGDKIEERLRKHNSNHKGFTGGIGDWTITYTEYFVEKKDAMKREKEIKKWKSKLMIEKLINNKGLAHPDL